MTVLVVACVGLAYVATEHERRALESAVERHGRALAQNLAEDAKEPLLNRDELSLGTLVQHSGEEEGLVGARLLARPAVRPVQCLEAYERIVVVERDQHDLAQVRTVQLGQRFHAARSHARVWVAREADQGLAALGFGPLSQGEQRRAA